MTGPRALREARLRWGKTAHIERRTKRRSRVDDSPLPDRFTVGRIVLGSFFEVKGDGESFDDAFAAADRAHRRALAMGCAGRLADLLDALLLRLDEDDIASLRAVLSTNGRNLAEEINAPEVAS